MEMSEYSLIIPHPLYNEKISKKVIPLSNDIFPGLSNPDLRNMLSERELQIMEAALEIFAEKGYQATSTREIAEKAGIAEGTIFRYFKTKKDLLLQLASTVLEKALAPFILRTIEDLFQTHRDIPIEDLFRMVIRDRLSLFRANARYIQLFLYELQFNEEFKVNFFHDVILRASDIIVEYLEEKQRNGIIRPEIDCHAVFMSMVANVAAFILWHNFLPGSSKISYSDDEIVNHVVNMVLKGILVQ